MVDSLDPETMSRICKKGFHSRQLELRDLIASEQTDSQADSEMGDRPKPDFCICGYCHQMPTEY